MVSSFHCDRGTAVTDEKHIPPEVFFIDVQRCVKWTSQ